MWQLNSYIPLAQSLSMLNTPPLLLLCTILSNYVHVSSVFLVLLRKNPSSSFASASPAKTPHLASCSQKNFKINCTNSHQNNLKCFFFPFLRFSAFVFLKDNSAGEKKREKSAVSVENIITNKVNFQNENDCFFFLHHF